MPVSWEKNEFWEFFEIKSVNVEQVCLFTTNVSQILHCLLNFY